MKRSFGEDLKGSFFGSAGWLFADMLLALSMLFLAANTVGIKPPPIPLPTPKVTPTPKTPPHLEQSYHRFTIIIDPNGLLSGNQNASNDVVRQVKAQHFLQGRTAGLIIVYGGAPGDAQIGRAQEIASKVYDILQNLGKHDPTFANVSRYDPLHLLGGDPRIVTIDIFLFAQ